MNEQDYRTTVVVRATPEQAFAAVTDVRGWWSEDLDGPTDTLGGEFLFHGNHEGVNVHRARIRVAELVPGRRVAWEVLDNHFTFVEEQGEWTGTRIVFELAETDGGCEIRFRHAGLVPSYECYDVCSNAWAFYVHDSLRSLVETGHGSPMARLDVAESA